MAEGAQVTGVPISEAVWQRTVTDLLTLYGWKWHHVHDSRRSNPGWPDIFCVRPPQVLAVELKTETGRVTPDQRRWLDLLAACGIPAYVWRPSDLEAVEAILSRKAPVPVRGPSAG